MRKSTGLEEYSLKGQIVEVTEEGLVRAEIAKGDKVVGDEQDFSVMIKELLAFCEDNLDGEKMVEFKCSIKAVKE